MIGLIVKTRTFKGTQIVEEQRYLDNRRNSRGMSLGVSGGLHWVAHGRSVGVYLEKEIKELDIRQTKGILNV